MVVTLSGLWLESHILDNPLLAPRFIALTLTERGEETALKIERFLCCYKSLGRSTRSAVRERDERPHRDLVALPLIC